MNDSDFEVYHNWSAQRWTAVHHYRGHRVFLPGLSTLYSGNLYNSSFSAARIAMLNHKFR